WRNTLKRCCAEAEVFISSSELTTSIVFMIVSENTCLKFVSRRMKVGVDASLHSKIPTSIATFLLRGISLAESNGNNAASTYRKSFSAFQRTVGKRQDYFRRLLRR